MFKKALSLLLATIMVFSLSVSAFAGSASDEADGIVVTCIGDSIANGHAQDWASECSPAGTPYRYGITYMSPERQASLYSGSYYDCYDGLFYARWDTDMFMSIKGYIDEQSIEALKDSIADTETALAECEDEEQSLALEQQLEADREKLALSGDPAAVAAYNAALIRNYETRTLHAYPAQVAAELNGYHVSDFNSFEEYYSKVPYRSLTASGLRAKDVRYMLDPEYKAEIDAQTEHENLWYYFGSFIRDDGRTVTKENYDKQLADTDLLLVELGGNDVFSAALYQLEDVENVDISASFSEYLKYALSYMPDAIENLKWVVDYCRELNPDMTVMLVGIYDYYLNNDLSTFKFNLTEDLESLIMNAFEMLTSAMNTAMRSYADTHKNVYFVDTNGVNTLSYESMSGDGAHPSIEGHDYISRRIISALPEELVAANNRKLDIAVDLLGVYDPESSEVTSVTVNGIPVRDYEIDGYTLTIHYKGIGAKLVTVRTSDEEKTGVIKWQVSYNLSDGYRTYQLYKVSDLLATLKLLLNKLNFFKTLFSFINK